MGAGPSNAGLHACSASTLLVDSSPPEISVYQVLCVHLSHLDLSSHNIVQYNSICRLNTFLYAVQVYVCVGMCASASKCICLSHSFYSVSNEQEKIKTSRRQLGVKDHVAKMMMECWTSQSFKAIILPSFLSSFFFQHMISISFFY